MRHIQMFLIIVQCLLLYSANAVEGIDEQSLKIEIASLLEYPVDRLIIEDITSQSLEQNARSQRPVAIKARAVLNFRSRNGDFVPMTIAIASLGVPMLEEIEQAAEMEASQSDDRTKGKHLPKRVELMNGGFAYHIPMLGPGGSQDLVMARNPNMNMDVVISLTARRDMDIMKGYVSSETEAYHRLITEGGDELTNRLIKCAEATIAKVMLMSPSSAQETPVRSTQPSTSSAVISDESTTSLESFDQIPSPVIETEPSKPFPWPWIVGAILLVVVAGGILFKLLRK